MQQERIKVGYVDMALGAKKQLSIYISYILIKITTNIY